MTPRMREALERVSALYPMVHLMASHLKLEHPGEIRIAVISKGEDGSGQVGPSWESESFLADLKIIAEELEAP